MATSSPLLHSSLAQSLKERAKELRASGVRPLFTANPQRHEQFRRRACGLELDFSRQLVDDAVVRELVALAEEAGLRESMAALQEGAEVNRTEGRAALHTALRMPQGAQVEVDEARALMRGWCSKLRSGEHRGFGGEPITDVVNIGIGGSDLGPRLISAALAPTASAPRVHFVANLDPEDLHQCLETLSPRQTLFIVCSKSFRTEETRVNAEAAKRWLLAAGADEATLAQHFLAVSSNLEDAGAFGIPAEHCLPMWDWVGGRYSLWSAIGLSAAIAMGWEAFAALLAGAHAMDQHARSSDPGDNLPMLCALLDCWNAHFLETETLAVLPYSHRLGRLADYLQQLVMESNGKGVNRSGVSLPYHSGPVLWGSAGTIGQHSFHQLLHQGTRRIAIEFVLPLCAGSTDTGGDGDADAQHARLVAHCLAQSSVLLNGRSASDAEADLVHRGESAERAAVLAPHLAMSGDRPHSMISFDSVTPAAVGALLSLWEHRTYFNACLLDINAFDQWGVELGKVVSEKIQGVMRSDYIAQGQDDSESQLDAGTRLMLQRWREATGK